LAKPKLECFDCNPPRQFKSLPGYNGHMQFKHDKTGTIVERPASKQTEMIQQLLDQQEHLLNQQDKLVNQQQALYALVAEQSDKRVLVDEPIGVFSGGNDNANQGNNNNNQGNNNQGNKNQGSGLAKPKLDEFGQVDVVDLVGYVQEYHCAGIKNGEHCGSPITTDQVHCPNCGNRLLWNDVAAK